MRRTEAFSMIYTTRCWTRLAVTMVMLAIFGIVEMRSLAFEEINADSTATDATMTSAPDLPSNVETLDMEYHYGEKFVALLNRISNTNAGVANGADTSSTRSLTRRHQKDAAKAIALSQAGNVQLNKERNPAVARKTAQKCLNLWARQSTCLLIYIYSTFDLGVDLSFNGGYERSIAVLDAVLNWFAHDDPDANDTKKIERPFINNIPFPVNPHEYRELFKYYILCLNSLGLHNAHIAVFNSVKTQARWHHPWQVSAGPVYVENKEIESGPDHMPRPFWPASELPEQRRILEEEVFPALQEELPNVPESFWVEHGETTIKAGGYSKWQEIRLSEMDMFLWSEKRCAVLPKTCSILQRGGIFTQRVIPSEGSISSEKEDEYAYRQQSHGVPGRLSLLRVSPGSALVPHTGGNNMRLSFHMGISLPPPVEIAPGVYSSEESATITVANQTARWQIGKVMFWDDSFIHSVQNKHPTASRVVFTGHLFKPAITNGDAGEIWDNTVWKMDTGTGAQNQKEKEWQHDYGKVEDETMEVYRSRMPDGNVFLNNDGCTMPNGMSEFEEATSAAAAANATGSFLDIIMHFVEHSSHLQNVPLVVSGEKEWFQTWQKNHDGPNARPFTVKNLVPWWQLDDILHDERSTQRKGKKSRLKEFSCAELVRVFGHLKAAYQKKSGGWVPGSEEELLKKYDETGFKLRTIAKRIPSCAVNKTWTQRQMRILKRIVKEKISKNTSFSSPKWFKTQSSHTSVGQLYKDLHVAGFGKRPPTYLIGTRFDVHWGGLVRKLFEEGILTEMAEHLDGVDRTDDKFYRAPYNNFAARSKFAKEQHESRAKKCALANKSLPDGAASAPPFLKLPRGLVLDEVFLYMGDRLSGTFFHDHGSGCSMMSTTAPRLWILYPPSQSSHPSASYCDVNGSLPSHLPRHCLDLGSREENCIEDLHPLDFLQHYWELLALNRAPILHIQRFGEVFCFPEGWYHSTVNLGPSTSVAWKLHRKRSFAYHSCRDIRDSCASDPVNGSYDETSCENARRSFRKTSCTSGADSADEERSVMPDILQNDERLMKEDYIGIKKSYFCCTRMVDGEEYGFVHASLVAVKAEIDALEKLIEGSDSIRMSSIVSAHAPAKLGMPKTQWAMPKAVETEDDEIVTPKSGYWLKHVPVIFSFKPAAQQSTCNSSMILALQATLTKEQRGEVYSGLKYLNSHVNKICEIVGDVNLLVEVDGNVRIADLAPSEDGMTCRDHTAEISLGIERCMESILDIEFDYRFSTHD